MKLQLPTFASLLIFFLSACSSLDIETELSETPSQAPSDTKTIKLKQKPEKKNVLLSLSAVGDIMLGTDYPDYRLAENDGKYLLKNVTDELSKADITFGNLEGTFGIGGKAEKKCPDLRRCYVFRMPPHYAQYLKDAGFDVMSLANNHSRDFGDSGRLLTMQTLDKYRIKHSGLQGDVARWNIKGLKVALIAFAPFRGAHDFLDLDVVKTSIEQLSTENDIVIVSFHAGAEGETHTRVPFEMEFFHGEKRGDVALFAHTAIESGADVILGHGPHVPRALELYQGKIIAYSLGNFCTTLGINVRGKNGLAPILSVTINQDGNFVSGKIDSARQIRPHGPVLDKKHRAAKLIKKLTEQDFPSTRLEIDAIGNIKIKQNNNTDNSLTKSGKVGQDSVK